MDHEEPLSRNIWLQVLGGAAMMLAIHFSSVHMVLVWIGNHRAVSYVLVAMLVPAFQLGFVVSQLCLAPHIARVAIRKRVVVIAAGVFAVLTAVVALTAHELRGTVLGLMLLACTVLLGLLFAIFTVASTDLAAKTTPQHRRGRLLTLGASLGGLLTLVAVMLLWAAVPGSLNDQVLFLWVAGFAWVVVAFAYFGVVEVPSGGGAGKTGWITLARARALFAMNAWLGRYLVLRIVLLGAELAIPFYAIHVSSLSHPSARLLSSSVVAIGLGQVLAGPIWGRWIDRHNISAVMAAVILTAVVGCIFLWANPMSHPTAPLAIAALFLVLSLAREGVVQGRTRLVTVLAPAEARPEILALAGLVAACMGLGIAFLLGLTGHWSDIRIPLLALIALNLGAALYVLKLQPFLGPAPAFGAKSHLH